MKKIEKQNYSALAATVLFFGMLGAFALITLIAPKEEISQTENRKLAKFPSFSVERVMDRRYMNGIESFLADHFIGRTDWITVKNSFVRAMGQRETGGVYITGDRLIQKFASADYENTDASIEAINSLASQADKPVYAMIVPTAAEIYADTLPVNAPNVNQKKYISYIYSSLSDNVITLDAYTSLSNARDRYIYYRNDHHWTSDGAYIAYYSCAKRMGFAPYASDMYQIEYASDSFRGSLYSKCLYDRTAADTLKIITNIYYPDAESVTVGNDSYNSIYMREFLGKKDKYSVFLGLNQPCVSIETGAAEGGSLLIFKDSYAHCFVPFLLPHYKKITLLDTRYIQNSYTDYADLNDYDEILFLYNAETFSSDSTISSIAEENR